MDWTAPLKSQQADFATRLAAGVDRLLRCQLQGCFSEAIAISAERFEQAANTARKGVMFATSDRHSDFAIEKVEQRHACCHLALEFLADCLGGAIATEEVAPDGVCALFADFPEIRIRVTIREDNPETTHWQVHPSHLGNCGAIACVLVRLPQPGESAADYHLVFAGFLPVEGGAIAGAPLTFTTKDLLYAGGLRAYLLSIAASSTPPLSEDWLHPLTAGSNFTFPIAVSNDGDLVATANYSGSIHLWQLSDATLKTFCQSSGWSLFPDADLPIAQGIRYTNAQDCFRGKLLCSLEGHVSGVSAIAFSTDRQTLISGSFNGTVKIWQLDRGELVSALNAHSGTVKSMAVSADGKLLATGSADRSLKIWVLPHAALLYALPEQDDAIASLCFSRDGKWLVCGMQNGTISVWDADTGKQHTTLNAHFGAVKSLILSSDGRTLASSSVERTIKVWDISSGTLARTLTGHPSPLLKLAPNMTARTLNLDLYHCHEAGWEHEL